MCIMIKFDLYKKRKKTFDTLIPGDIAWINGIRVTITGILKDDNGIKTYGIYPMLVLFGNVTVSHIIFLDLKPGNRDISKYTYPREFLGNTECAISHNRKLLVSLEQPEESTIESKITGAMEKLYLVHRNFPMSNFFDEVASLRRKVMIKRDAKIQRIQNILG